MIIRPARLADVDALLQVKRGLRLDRAGAAGDGGFLLGASPEAYAFFVEHASVLVLEDAAGAIGGFSVTLPDAVLRRTDVWTRRRSIAWEGGSWDALEGARVAYFDQLAVRPGRRLRLYAAALASAALHDLVAAGHQHLFATVVREPVRNRASLPLLHALGARRVGEIEEAYPQVGRLLSDVYHAEIGPDAVGTLFRSSALGRRVAGMVERAVGRPSPRIGIPGGST